MFNLTSQKINDGVMTKSYNFLKKNLAQNKSAIYLVISLSVFLLLSMVLICNYLDIPVERLTRDPAASLAVPFYSGYFSQLGGIFWIASACFAFFTGIIIKNGSRKFMLFSGGFVLLLAIDDIFMLHDGLFPEMGINENVFYLTYAILTIVYFRLFYRTILKSPFVLLLLAFGFLGLSVIIDLLPVPGSINRYIFEDGFKMMGIISWMAYTFKTGKRLLERSARAPGELSVVPVQSESNDLHRNLKPMSRKILQKKRLRKKPVNV